MPVFFFDWLASGGVRTQDDDGFRHSRRRQGWRAQGAGLPDILALRRQVTQQIAEIERLSVAR